MGNDMQYPLYQLGVRAEDMVYVIRIWINTRITTRLAATPSLKDSDIVVVETRDQMFAAQVVTDCPKTKVKISNINKRIIEL